MSVALLHFNAVRRQRIAAVPFAEFIVARIQAGHKRLADGSQRAEIGPGGYLIVTPGTLLNIENVPAADGPYRSSCLTVSRELLVRPWPADGTPVSWTVLDPGPALDQVFSHTERGLHEQLPEALLHHRVRELLEALSLAGFRPALTHQSSVTERVRMLLAAQPAQSWRAEQVAERLSMSTATLRRRLTAEQTSFRTVLEEVRLAHALTLIQTTTQPLKRIAECCGYLSPSRFATRFRMRFGTLPSTLRD